MSNKNPIGWFCNKCGKSDLADSEDQLAKPEHVSHCGFDIGSCGNPMTPFYSIQELEILQAKNVMPPEKIIYIFNKRNFNQFSDWKYDENSKLFVSIYNHYFPKQAKEIAIILYALEKIRKITSDNFEKDLDFAEISELATHPEAILDYRL